MIEIDKASGIPVYIQLAERIRLLVHRGSLKAGQVMPTVRSLAVQLGINANTVARVYRDLQRDGLLRLERGVGTFVAETAESLAVPQQDFEAIADLARQLIRRARNAGFGATELARYIETLWKEEAHASR